MTSSAICSSQSRRADVRARRQNGMDYLDVGNGMPVVLTVFLFGAPPDTLSAANVRIDGGRRIRRITATHVRLPDKEETNDFIEITVDKPGDFSTYTLRLVNAPDGRPEDTPLDGFDPRYAQLDFSFKVNCPSDLDCQDATICPPAPRTEPAIDYLAKDYASFRQLILDRLALMMPDWQERHLPDLGITLVELLAYTGDYLSYYQDAVATEAYLQTARQRISVRRHTRLIDYPMHEGCNARAWAAVETDLDVSLLPDSFYFITGAKETLGTDDVVLNASTLDRIPFTSYEAFEPVVPITDQPIPVLAAHSRISFYTWGDAQCCLPRGATSATLKDSPPASDTAPPAQTPPSQPGQETASPSTAQSTAQSTIETASRPTAAQERRLQLKVGDILVFEEVMGPITGNPADADPTHRHAVRLTGVEQAHDPLYDQPVVEITWAEEDALPFALCLSAIGNAPQCTLLQDVSIARGNVFLVEHGRRIEHEALGGVDTPDDIPNGCDDIALPTDIVPTPVPFRPVLAQGPLTFHTGWSATASAAALLVQDPRRCTPWLTVTTQETSDADWTAKTDLLHSAGDDSHFVVEMDNEGIAHLRFGDGELGKLPTAGTEFTAAYHVGRGRAGNVGRNAIRHIVFRTDRPDGANLTVTNPLPAQGGVAPEPLSQVKMLAPGAIHREIERAIIPADYARLAERVPGVRRATAVRRWTGSWYLMHVGILPFASENVDEKLLDAVYAGLFPYRRLGCDLQVAAATYVPLDITIQVCVQPDILRGHVKAALSDLFSSRILPDGRRGLFHPDALSFGESVRISRLIAAAQSIAGVQDVTKIRVRRFFDVPDSETQDGVLHIGPLEVAQMDNDPSFPEHGKLTLDVRGGR